MRLRVLEASLDFPVDPAAAFCTLYADAPNSFWLDSSGPDHSTGGDEHKHSYTATGMSFLGSSSTVVTADVDGVAELFDVLRSGLAGHAGEIPADPESTAKSPAGFALGWVGWFGYEVRAVTLGDPVPQQPRHPAAAFLWVDRLVAIDPTTGRTTLRALGERWDGELAAWRDATVEALRSPATPGEGTPVHTAPSWRYPDDDYLAMIGECQRAIADGDAYQLCLTNEVSVARGPGAAPIDPVATYLALRASSPTHHGGLIRAGGTALVSATPERFLSVSPGGVVETKPIKGTRPRAAGPDEDRRLLQELLDSDKERAENVMIVDLMRNDLGRVCETGTVRVPALLQVESYAHVHQLVSTVRGRLRAGLDGLDAVASCFPAGSMTGAPKLAASRILSRLEQRARGVYSGAFGYLGVDGAVDLAMVIRSAVIDESGATIGAGGGITALSVPEEELAEVKLKAAAVLAALRA
ncbi:anthranilate synthase component I family protein [Diaminobutyricimonas sp. LJ205]|uniref:anthranilate synthase component I family protein n=1 Tax=Diaminobutyricimonas sp. LJ205 TaxID=2683590 RepID=UPI0012F50A0C|nr:anthranilate synthase component I family protein [Diaminobutyricimonas sp. LJ205]